MNSPQYDVTPDDQRFIMIRAAETGLPDFIAIQNFFERITEMLGAG